MGTSTEPPILSSSRRVGWHLGVLLLVAFAVHVPALFHPFFLDDYVYVSQAHDFTWANAAGLFRAATLDQSASGVWWVPTGALPFYRPIAQLTFAADYSLWGLRPFGYHLTNLVLHLVCTTLVWRLARRLFEVPARATGSLPASAAASCSSIGATGGLPTSVGTGRQAASGTRPANSQRDPYYALAVAVVFALHPIHGEAVTWISGRFDLLVCVCVLAAVLSYVRWSGSSATGWGWAAFSIVWFAVGLGCKETALVLPAVLVGLEVFRCGPRRPARQLLAVGVVYAIVSAGYIAVRVVLFGGIFGRLPPPYGLDRSSPLIALTSFAWNLAQYVLDLALCIHIEPAYLPRFWLEHLFLFGAAVAVAVLLLAWVLIAGRSRASRAGLAWLAMFAAPSLLSMPGERNVYLASMGLAVLIGAVYRAFDTPNRWLRPTSYAVITAWLVICLVQQTLMGFIAGSAEKVYRDLASLLPDPPRDARIYVVNQNPLNSVGFTQAIRLRYSRPDLSGCALSVAPTLNASSTDGVSALGPNTIRIAREGGAFFTSFVEQFHRFSDPVSTLAEAGRRLGIELLNPPRSYEGLTVLDLHLPSPLNDPRTQLFYWDNHRVSGRLDLLWMRSLTELRRCVPTSLDPNP